MLSGIVASSGIGIGKAIIISGHEPAVERRTGLCPRQEKERFAEAALKFVAEIREASEAVARNVGKKEADILRTQISFIDDPELHRELEETLVAKECNLEFAFSEVCDGFIGIFANMDDDLFRSRAADLRDLKLHMLAIMMEVPRTDFTRIPHGSIIVANELLPSFAASINPARIRGIITEKGNTRSHLSIISRAMGLPALVAVDGLLDRVKDGDTLIVNGETGEILCNPSPQLLEKYMGKHTITF